MTHRRLRRPDAIFVSTSSGKPRRRLWFSGSLAVALLVIALIARLFGIMHEPEPAPESPGSKAAAAPDSPISGYFISATSSDETNLNKLKDIKAVGGDTLITFGTLLKPATLESISVDCRISGVNCTDASTQGIKVNRYFTYSDGSRWGAPSVKCPRDRALKTNGKFYTVMVLPAKGDGCTSHDGTYDVILVGGSSEDTDDPSISLASASTNLNMKYYAGLPSPVKRSDIDYLPDLSYQRTLELFTERFLQYQATVNDVPGLGGFYHHTEMPLSNSSTFDPILDLYRMQNKAVHRIFPTRTAIVSPYLDTRRNTVSISLEEARQGARRIAETSAGLSLIIAIQDGMGTGKAGAFLAHEADDEVDRYAATVVGNGSWSSKYIAPIKEYFLAAASGLSGTSGVLWANLEGMTPATPSNLCGNSLRGQSNKPRLDRQLQQLANAQKVVSFMWDSYYTCKGTGIPLKDQLKSNPATPIITNAEFRASDGRVEIEGFSLEGGSVKVEWTPKSGEHRKIVAEPVSLNAKYGLEQGANTKLQLMNVVVGPTTVETHSQLSVTVINGSGSESEKFILSSNPSPNLHD